MDDPGGYRRLAAIEERVYTRPCKAKIKTFYFVYPFTAIFVQDTEKYPKQLAHFLKYKVHKRLKILENIEKRLDRLQLTRQKF